MECESSGRRLQSGFIQLAGLSKWIYPRRQGDNGTGNGPGEQGPRCLYLARSQWTSVKWLSPTTTYKALAYLHSWCMPAHRRHNLELKSSPWHIHRTWIQTPAFGAVFKSFEVIQVQVTSQVFTTKIQVKLLSGLIFSCVNGKDIHHHLISQLRIAANTMYWSNTSASPFFQF